MAVMMGGTVRRMMMGEPERSEAFGVLQFRYTPCDVWFYLAVCGIYMMRVMHGE